MSEFFEIVIAIPLMVLCFPAFLVIAFIDLVVGLFIGGGGLLVGAVASVIALIFAS